MIDVASKEHDQQAATAATAASRRPVRQPPQTVSFFQALFGGGPAFPPKPPNKIR
jgi:hypothetical protein